ncbi:hypothetical protein GMES_1875 [Paraglaciecola mesophila KMM 241]|uniref:Uncharacterized protein n=1 Tax=Paraglaciecola mesophila KMM 241 TaxID=1128912 RepID=K6YJJ8_9ALTE|nr:hypothetical protein GMES_1875 [Paraglaciecola mesophila KMM 241]
MYSKKTPSQALLPLRLTPCKLLILLVKTSWHLDDLANYFCMNNLRIYNCKTND